MASKANSKIMENFHLSEDSTGSVSRPSSCTGSFTLLKISVIYGLLNKQSVSLKDFFGITFFGIGSKYINKGHFIYYFFISTARGFPSTRNYQDVEAYSELLTCPHLPPDTPAIYAHLFLVSEHCLKQRVTVFISL